MNFTERMLKIASEKGPIWDGIESEGYYDAKQEASAELFCQQNTQYSYKQYNSQSKGMIFRIAPPEYFTQFEQNLQQSQPQYEDQTANEIQQVFNAMGDAAQKSGKEQMEKQMQEQGYVDYRKPEAAQLHQEKYPQHQMQTLTDENNNTIYRFTLTANKSRLKNTVIKKADLNQTYNEYDAWAIKTELLEVLKDLKQTDIKDLLDYSSVEFTQATIDSIKKLQNGEEVLKILSELNQTIGWASAYYKSIFQITDKLQQLLQDQ